MRDRRSHSQGFARPEVTPLATGGRQTNSQDRRSRTIAWLVVTHAFNPSFIPSPRKIALRSSEAAQLILHSFLPSPRKIALRLREAAQLILHSLHPSFPPSFIPCSPPEPTGSTSPKGRLSAHKHLRSPPLRGGQTRQRWKGKTWYEQRGRAPYVCHPSRLNLHLERSFMIERSSAELILHSLHPSFLVPHPSLPARPPRRGGCRRINTYAAHPFGEGKRDSVGRGKRGTSKGAARPTFAILPGLTFTSKDHL